MTVNEDVQRMSDALIGEILNALGLPQTTGWRRLFGLLARRATDHLSHIGLTFDRLIEERGLPKAAEWGLTHWCRDILVRGQGNIPTEGPLLVLSNHPGAYDALVILKHFLRQDVRVIASDLPFIRYLRNTSQHIFFIPINTKDTYHRMSGMLSAVRYLKNGGAVILMGSGTIDPDPAIYPGAIA
ncbi:MAG: 1-acyl-sn-glycerol-3-phosphate acyltransferase, partial [Chloroflexota bacterium]